MKTYVRWMLMTAGGLVALVSQTSSQWEAAQCGIEGQVRSLVVNCNDLFALTKRGVYLSTDEGARWQLASAPLPDTLATRIAASNSHLFLARGHAFVSTIFGASWSYSDSGLGHGEVPELPNWVSSVAVSGTNVLAGTSAGHFVSADTGATWNASGLESYDVRVVAARGTEVYAGLKGGSAYYSSDGGMTWAHNSVGLPMYIPEPILNFAFCGTHVFASTYDDALYLSTDPLAPWIQANTGLPNQDGPYYRYSAAGTFTNFYAGAKKGVYASTDGINWTPFNDGLRAEAVAGGAGDQGLAVCGNYLFAIIWDSTGTRVWRRALSDPVPVQLETFAATMMGGDRVQLRWRTASETNNYGFEIQKTDFPPDYRSVPDPIIPGHGTTVVPHEYEWTDRAGGPGDWYRLKQIDLDGTWHFSEGIHPAVVSGLQDGNRLPYSYSMEQNYPNPFNPSTVIRYSLPARARVGLMVFNVLGEAVATLVNAEEAAGVHEVGFDATGLASGIYFVRFTAGIFSQTRKIVVLR